MADIIDIERAIVVVSTKQDDEVNTTLLSTLPNVEDRSPPTNINQFDPNDCSVRMHVNPFHPLSRNRRITPVHYQKCVPQLLLPSSSSSLSDIGRQAQMNDEWRSIWQRLNSFMTHDREMVEVCYNSVILRVLLTILILLTINLPALVDLDGSHHFEVEKIQIIALRSFALIFVVYLVYIYVRFGDPNRRLCTGILRTSIIPISYIAKYLAVAFLLSFILFSLMELDGELFLGSAFAVIVLFGSMYFLWVTCCIPILLSWRHYFYYKFDRNNEVLKKIYYEIKNINNGLHYFTLHPKIAFHMSRVVVDVYYVAASDGHGDGNNGIDTIPEKL